ncbi:BcSTC5, similar to sesquiterpene cyclase [Botrytis cinerea T4]|uniref:BcSTC5, similar to sesquiterpene cyclase n=1 Tax=Botryotinia fuckeliana (strain T4) TaxID=999810 RepID=G2YT23_BOTF4|nr:BcSTC5, similar to sesquiterpene cyclase [Botrytis cinerea T4]
MATLVETQISSIYHSIDTSKTHPHFSRFPAAISIANDEIEQTLRELGERATEPGTRVRRRIQIRHTCPYGDPFGICHASAFPERLVLLGSIVEIMWVHDDITEEIDLKEAMEQHELLKKVLTTDIDSKTFEFQNDRQVLLANILQKAIQMDPEAAPTMIQTLRNYLDTFDNRDDDFDTMSDYMPYRIANCGYWISSYFIRWGMGTVLSEEDYKSIREYDITMGNILGLTNDYFSWHVEKDQPTGRIRNGVRVLMKQHNIPAEIAQKLLLGIIIEEESKAVKLREERLKTDASQSVLEYIKAIELYVGGSCYWHSTAPRYQRFE